MCYRLPRCVWVLGVLEIIADVRGEQTSRTLRGLLVASPRVWLDVFRGQPMPLQPAPGRTASSCAGPTLHACALRYKRLHLRGARNPSSSTSPALSSPSSRRRPQPLKLAPRKTVPLVSHVVGDSTVPVLLRVIRGGRWVASVSSSGRIVIWDANPSTRLDEPPCARPAARLQLACAPFSLQPRTVAWDEAEDSCSAVVAVSHSSYG